MSDQEIPVIIRERGRREQYGDCRVYLEIVSPVRSGLTTMEVFGLDEGGRVIGSGKEWRPEGIGPGMLVGVTVDGVRPSEVAGWHVQLAGLRVAPISLEIPGLDRAALESTSAPSEFVTVSDEVTATERRMPVMRNGYAGPVYGSVRSDFFHHPDCRSVRAFVVDNRREYESPSQAWDRHLYPCFKCLYDGFRRENQ